jgi:hypothetical protein
MGMDGISRLIAVTQLKASNANDAALEGQKVQRPSRKHRRTWEKNRGT